MNFLNNSSIAIGARIRAGTGARIRAETRSRPGIGLQDRAKEVLPE